MTPPCDTSSVESERERNGFGAHSPGILCPIPYIEEHTRLCKLEPRCWMLACHYCSLMGMHNFITPRLSIYAQLFTLQSKLYDCLYTAALWVQLVSSRINITVKATGRIHFHVPICRVEKRKVQVSAVAHSMIAESASSTGRWRGAGWKLTQPPAAAPTFSHQPSYKYN